MDSAQLKIVITAIDEASAGLAKVSESLKTLGGISDEVNTQLADGSKASAEGISRVTVAATEEGAAFERLNALLVQNAAVGRANLDATMEQTAVMEDMNSKVTKTSGSFSKLGMGAAVGAVAIGYAIDKTVKSYANLQTLVTKLSTSAGESVKNLGMVTAGIQNIARQTGTSTTDLANAMYYIESAGFHGAAGLKVLTAAAKGAKDEQASALSVADATSTIMNAYKNQNYSAAEAVNGMITAVSRGKTTLQLFSSSLSSVLPIAAAVGISFAQVSGAIATMTSQGMTAQQATQDLRHTIQALSNPSSVQTKEMLQLGLSSQTVAKQLGDKNVGLVGVIENLSTSILKQMGPSGMVLQSALQNSMAAAKDVQEELAAMPGSLKGVAQELVNGTISWTEYRKAIRAMSPANESLGQQFENTFMQAHSFNTQLKAGTPDVLTYEAALAKATGGSTGLTTALMLTGAHTATFNENVKAVSGSMSNATDKIKGWSDMQGTFNQQMSQLKEEFITLGQTMGQALIPILSAVAKTLTALFLPVADLITKFPVVSAVILVGAAAFLTFVASMIAIKKATEYISTATDEFKKLTEATKMQALATKVAAAAQWIWTAATDATTAAVIALQAALDTMGIGEILAIIGAILAAIIALGSAIYEMVRHWDTTKKYIADFWGAVEGIFQAGIHKLGEILNLFIVLFTNPKQGFIDFTKDIQRAWGDLVYYASRWGKELYDAFIGGWQLEVRDSKNIFSTLRSSLSQGVGDIQTTLANSFGRVKANAPQWGKDLIEGYKHGMETMWHEDLQSMKSWLTIDDSALKGLTSLGPKIVSAIGSGIMSAIRTNLSIGKTILTAIGRGITSSIGTDITAGKSIITNLVTGMNQGVIGIINFYKNLPSRIGSDLIGVGQAISDFIMKGSTSSFSDYSKMNKIGVAILKGLGMVFIAILAGIILLAVSIGIAIINGIVNGVRAAIKELWKVLTQDVFNTISKAFSGVGTWIYQSGKDLIGGFVHGITDSVGSVGKAITSMGSSAIKSLKGVLGIHSPSTVFAEIGQNVDEGLKQGITGNKQVATQAATNLAQSTVAGARQGISSSTVSSASGTTAGGAMVGQLHIHFDGPLMGNQAQAQQLATSIYQALQQIARQHGNASALPSIGIRPV